MGQSEDLKNIKSLLNSFPTSHEEQLILFGASLETLREIREKMDKLHDKISSLEMRLTSMERLPKPARNQENKKAKQSEQKIEPQKAPIFQEEQTEKNESDASQVNFISEKRKESVIGALKKHNRLSADQLARIIGLSRTRCNEYLKDMEREGVLESIMEDKRKFYSVTG